MLDLTHDDVKSSDKTKEIEMKQGVFIFHQNEIREEFLETRVQGGSYNTRELELPEGAGITSMLKCFAISGGRKAVKRVLVRATALGVFELFLNGQRIGEKTSDGVVYDELKPGWTDYRYRAFEFEYDITHLIKNDNVFVASISRGWWTGRISFGFYGYRKTAFCGEIEIEYKNGDTQLISTDESWQTTSGGPVRFAGIWDGEYYDARIPHPSVSPEAHAWENASIYNDFCIDVPAIVPAQDKVREKPALNRRPMSAIVHKGVVKGNGSLGKIKVLSKHVGDGCEEMVLKKGQKLILDMGQNMVGRPEITIKAVKGAKITGMVAEFLNDSGDPTRENDGPEGSLYVKNYRSACARLVYISNGKARQTYSPTHTFYGFRYLEISADANITVLGVRGVVIGSEMEETASFECDNPEVNQLWSNIVWGMRGNYLSVPTDCPQRDERLGWTGDTQIFCGAGSYLANVQSFLSKWLVDLSDSQREYNGEICAVVPRIFKGKPSNASAWADAALIVPYRLWLMYNDVEVVARQYASMEAYMKSIENNDPIGPEAVFGDWLNYEVTRGRYISACYYKHDADLMAHFSRLLGKSDRAHYYEELSRRITEKFAAAWITDGELTMTSQTGCLLSLAFDLLPEDVREKTIRTLREKIVDNNYTLTTGFVGTGILNQTLAKVGLNDLAYSLLLQTADPSWLYSVRQGATTVWERWNSYTKDGGFGEVSMNSFNHYAYGAVAEWLMATVAGILPDESAPGFEKFILAPEPDMRQELPQGQSRINRVRAHYDTKYGRIESAWEYIGEKIEYSFVIPKGCSATVRLITDTPKITLNGVAFTADELGTYKDGKIEFTLGAGRYCVN